VCFGVLLWDVVTKRFQVYFWTFSFLALCIGFYAWQRRGMELSLVLMGLALLALMFALFCRWFWKL